MFGKIRDKARVSENKPETIRDRLDDGENVVVWVRQSRVRPGGAAVLTPNTIFITEKRIDIRDK